MDLHLTGRRAIVTGASRGIGLAIASALATEGADVVIAARSRTDLERAAAELTSRSGRRVLPVPVDTADDGSVRAMVAAANDALGGVDILVNAAARPGGHSRPPGLAEVTDELFYEDVNVKVMGYLRCAREVAPGMVDQGWGRIISVSGLAARQTGSLVGSMRNVAVAAMTKNLADELGPHGVNVTVVHPGVTRTEKTAGVLATRAAELGVAAADVESKWARAVSIGRLVEASEVAAVVAFLASPVSVAITGDAIAVGGGVKGPIHY
ncbi:MAG: SDR family oxidoreductase [Actinomycetota bacterium]|jgi:NAD(P)-dependent dehydrogenase (short-subunit alcohol dehydrogenase family)|nr:SDR family oxidoreductase [Actinomycetota bacterium]